MESLKQINFAYAVVLSFVVHLMLLWCFFLPDSKIISNYKNNLANAVESADFSGHDIIMNMNADSQKNEGADTLLSDKDSSASGKITNTKGRRWLNNSLDFTSASQSTNAAITSKASSEKKFENTSDNFEGLNILHKPADKDKSGSEARPGQRYAIPDYFNFTPENSLYFSNDKRFSFNTVKFEQFDFFKNMKDKIAANWYPPLFANASLGGYNSFTRTYTPGQLRIKTIPNQAVKLIFVLDRNGDIVDLVVKEGANSVLKDSCVQSILAVKNFGKVPVEILNGGYLIVPFVFIFATE